MRMPTTASIASSSAARSAAAPISRTRVLAVLAVLMALPLIPAYFLIGEGLRLDEAQSLWQTSRSIEAIFAIVAGDVHVPFYHMVLHGWRLITEDSVVSARMLSFIFFELSIPALYLLGARAYSKRVGLFAAFLFALSPFMNWYAVEIRMYTLFTLLAILNQYLFARIFSDKRPSNVVWGFYALTALLGVFTHYFFFLGLMAQALFYWMRRDIFPPKAIRRFVIVGGLIFVAFVPWFWNIYQTGTLGFQTPNLTTPDSVNLFSAFSQFLFGYQNDGINTILLSFWPGIVILGLFGLRRNSVPLPQTQYFYITVLASFALAFFASFVFAPVFVSRYLVFTLPALYLILGSIFASYNPRLRLVAEASLAILMIVTLSAEILNPRTPVKEDYRQAAEYMNAHATAQDKILVSAPFTLYPIQYYYRGPAPMTTLPAWDQYAYGPIPPFNLETLPEEVGRATADFQNVYVLLSYDQGYEEEIRRYFESNYQRLYVEEYSKDLTLYVYRLRYNTPATAITTRL